jgi:hypothetical protein
MRWPASIRRAVFSAALEIAVHPEQPACGLAQHRHQSSSTQVSLVPPPCEELTTSEPFLQRHPGQPARRDVDARGRDQHEGAQVDMPRRQARAGEGSARSTALSVGWAM